MVKSEEIVIMGDEFMNIIDVLDTAVKCTRGGADKS